MDKEHIINIFPFSHIQSPMIGGFSSHFINIFKTSVHQPRQHKRWWISSRSWCKAWVEPIPAP